MNSTPPRFGAMLRRWLSPFLATAILAPAGLPAYTQSGLDAFLTKLNGHYVCLDRDGLKRLRCSMTDSMWDQSVAKAAGDLGSGDARVRALRAVRFEVDYRHGQPNDLKVLVRGWAPTQDADFNAKVKKTLQTMVVSIDQEMLRAWANFVCDAIVHPADFKKCKVQDHGQAGFDVLGSMQDLDMHFNPQGTMVNLQMNMGGPMQMQPEFAAVHGRLLLTTARMGNGVFKATVRFEHGMASGFAVISGIDIHVAAKDRTFDDHLGFSGYRIER